MLDQYRKEIRERMRSRRRKRILLNKQDAIYHVISRTPNQQFLFDDRSKEKFRELMWRQAQFSGVEILAYCIMSNHFHLLIRIPYEETISDEALLFRYKKLYNREHVSPSALTVAELEFLLKTGGKDAADERARIVKRMGSLPHFVKELKQRYSIWFNRTHNNKGTIWSDRYKSLIVQNDRHALSVVSAYIDLNPVRAEVVKEPGDYRFCSYSESMAANALARRGLQFIMNHNSWRQAISSYRLILFGKGYRSKGDSGKNRGTISGEDLIQIIKTQGEVSLSDVLRCRIRYLTDGLALGGEHFVEQVFEHNRDAFSLNRKQGWRKMLGDFWGDLRSARDLKKNIYGLVGLKS